MLASSLILVFAVTLVVATLRIRVDAPHDSAGPEGSAGTSGASSAAYLRKMLLAKRKPPH